MLAKDVMSTQLITFKPTTTVLEAIEQLVARAISGAPVVDDNGKLTGIVTEKDLMVVDNFLGSKQITQVTIAEFMSRKVMTVEEDRSLADIVTLFIQKNIKRVPVVQGDKLVGIVSRRDILKYILTKSTTQAK